MILLVEDEAITRNALADTLRREGHEVIEAADGNKALALLQESSFDLVITDVLIPKQSGFVLVARIRVTWPHMPILLISGQLSPEAGKLVSKGFTQFIQKPIDPVELVATVKRLLRKSVRLKK
jgi:two-component system, OmpR family, response regulator